MTSKVEWDDKEFKSAAELTIYLMKKDMARDKADLKEINIKIKIFFALFVIFSTLLLLNSVKDFRDNKFWFAVFQCSGPIGGTIYLWKKGAIKHIFKRKRND